MECGKALQVSIDGNVTIDFNSGTTSKVQQVSKFHWHEHQSNNKLGINGVASDGQC
jgi:hypothetical protein